MPETPDGHVLDRRRAPFCFQTHDALETLRDSGMFAGARLTTALAVYLVLTEAANRIGGAGARNGFTATRPELADLAGISVDTLDRYVADFVKVGLVEVVRRRVEGVNLPNQWVLSEPAPVPPGGRTGAARGSRVGAAQVLKKTSKGKKGSSSPSGGAPGHDLERRAYDPEVPPPVVLVDGQNLPLNALAEALGVKAASPRYKEVIAALNGSRGQEGIRHLFWRELVEYVETNKPEERERLNDVAADGEAFAKMLVARIPQKIRQYHQKMPGAILSPSALHRHWLDLAHAPIPGQDQTDLRGLSTEEIVERYS